jgi:hypothetical protein
MFRFSECEGLSSVVLNNINKFNNFTNMPIKESDQWMLSIAFMSIYFIVLTPYIIVFNVILFNFGVRSVVDQMGNPNGRLIMEQFRIP